MISRTSCAHTRAHTRSRPRRRPHTARAWTLSFCARFAGRASLPPASAFRPFLSSATPRLVPPPQHTAPGLAPAPPPPRGPSPALPREKGGRGVAPRAQRRPGSAGSWGRRAGLGPAPCLFSLRPLNARLRRKDYPRRIMPGVNTRANKSACTTPPTPLGRGPRAGGRERAPRC